jgi:hypothetical protein
MNRTHALAAAALSLLLAASPAQAKPGVARSSGGSGGGVSSLSFWGVLDPGPIDGLGLGFRVGVPLVPQGILHAQVRDELVLELGADFVHYSERIGYSPYYVDYSWNGLLAVGGVAWNFWFTPNLALYPKLDLGWWFGWYRGWDARYDFYYGRHDFDGIFLQGAAGLIYRTQSKLDFRLELGSGLVRVGLGIPF